jgi:hypothetical protein
MSDIVDSTDIARWGSIEGRRDHYDDDDDVDFAISFLNHSFRRSKADVLVLPHPFGQKDVDIGCFIGDNLILNADVEMVTAWNTDWPSNYRCGISFLKRKERYLTRPESFVIIQINKQRTKLTYAFKDEILKYATRSRGVQGKTDYFKDIGFDDVIMAAVAGSSFNEMEKKRFKNRSVLKTWNGKR